MRTWMLPFALIACVAASAAPRAQGPAASQNAPAEKVALDYEFFKVKVQAVLVAKRPGHAACYTCHYLGQHVLRDGAPPLLEKLQPGQTTFSEEQSKKNFDMVSAKVVPGNLRGSRLLMHTLFFDAGGDLTHQGGKHWTSTTDPEWQTLAAWVMGQKLPKS